MSLIISHIYAKMNVFDFSVMDSQYRGSFPKHFYLNHPFIEDGLEAWAQSSEAKYLFYSNNEASQVISGNSSNRSQNWEEITDEQKWQALNRRRQTRINKARKARKKQKIKELTSEYESRLENISTEEKKQLGTIRIGQDVLRDYLLDTRRKCPLTDIENRNLLRVSHIKPWAQFEDIRLDPDNCLLLSPFWDVAFDQGLITFSQTGILQFSEDIIRELDRIGSYNNRINFENILDKDNHLDYLEWHREKWHHERVFPD